MDYTGTHVFDAPIERVWEMFRDKASHLAKFEAMGHTDIDVRSYEVDDERMTLVVARSVTVELPGFAKKVLQPTNTVVSTDVWEDRGDGTYGGHFEVSSPGTPISSTGTTLLRPEGDDRTYYEVQVDLEVKVPIIGRKIADWAKGDVAKQMDQEFAAGDTWLAQHG